MKLEMGPYVLYFHFIGDMQNCSAIVGRGSLAEYRTIYNHTYKFL